MINLKKKFFISITIFFILLTIIIFLFKLYRNNKNTEIFNSEINQVQILEIIYNDLIKYYSGCNIYLHQSAYSNLITGNEFSDKSKLAAIERNNNSDFTFILYKKYIPTTHCLILTLEEITGIQKVTQKYYLYIENDKISYTKENFQTVENNCFAEETN